MKIKTFFLFLTFIKSPEKGAHGGGAFSGKDYTKVDRSAAYAARWVAKSLVHTKLCSRILVQLSYAIGIAKPLSLHVDTYGSGKVSGKIGPQKIKILTLRRP